MAAAPDHPRARRLQPAPCAVARHKMDNFSSKTPLLGGPGYANMWQHIFVASFRHQNLCVFVKRTWLKRQKITETSEEHVRPNYIIICLEFTFSTSNHMSVAYRDIFDRLQNVYLSASDSAVYDPALHAVKLWRKNTALSAPI